jgi:hypothetical protein
VQTCSSLLLYDFSGGAFSGPKAFDSQEDVR